MVDRISETESFRSTVWSAGAGCHGGCGVDLHVLEGKPEKIEGVKDHPYNQGSLCPRALARKDYVYDKDRLRTPLTRKEKRGSDAWRVASWGEALDLIERRMNQVRENHGAESTLFVQVTGHDVGGWLVFLTYNFGSPNWLRSLPGNSRYRPLSRWRTCEITTGLNPPTEIPIRRISATNEARCKRTARRGLRRRPARSNSTPHGCGSGERTRCQCM